MTNILPDRLDDDAQLSDRLQALNQEIDDLYLEVEELHHETAVLQGLMAGSCAYFMQQLMLGHQSQTGLTAQVCEQIVINALQRILSTQNRFGYEVLPEIEAVLEQMSQPLSLDRYHCDRKMPDSNHAQS
jgi:hypothetical protein